MAQPPRLSALGQPNQELAEPDRLHSLFVQNIAHELRTPLAVIHGYAYLLHEGDLGALTTEQEKVLSTIVSQSDRLRKQVELIGTLLAVEARMLLFRRVALAEIAGEVVSAARPAADRVGLALELECAADLPLVWGDADALRHALGCLIDNALKFTPAGGNIRMTVFPEPERVCVSVTDTGIGMSPEQLAQVFVTRFYQIDGSTTRRYGGYGLGATVVGSVVRAHTGWIEAASRPGRGSQFIVRLPALPADASITLQGGSIMTLRRILIVDDAVHVAAVIQSGLERLPHCEVVVATNGPQALELFRQKPFDLLITDYKMPEMDGLTLAERVHQSYPQTGIILLTAYADPQLHEQATRLSIEYVLDKPVGLATIRNAVTEILVPPGDEPAAAL